MITWLQKTWNTKDTWRSFFFIRASDTIPSQQRNKTIWSGNAMEKLYK